MIMGRLFQQRSPRRACRQPLALFSAPSSAKVLSSDSRFSIAVSYTHLDVYKRQVLDKHKSQSLPLEVRFGFFIEESMRLALLFGPARLLRVE